MTRDGTDNRASTTPQTNGTPNMHRDESFRTHSGAAFTHQNSLSNIRGTLNRDSSWGRRSNFSFKDGTASVEQHLGILLEDLSVLGSQANISAGDELVLREAFLGLHYVWRMRIHGTLDELDRELMERLRQALLLFVNKVRHKGPRFLSRPVPTRNAAFALVVFCGLIHDVPNFRQVVNDNMTIAHLRHVLAVHWWLLKYSEVEDDEMDMSQQVQAVGWTTVTFVMEEIRKLLVSTTLFLVHVLGACQDWRELVESDAHAAFERYASEVRQWERSLSGDSQGGDSKPKALLAPKGTYWDVPTEKVLKMFRTTLTKGLTEKEVQARREVYGRNALPESAKASALSILLRQLADLIVLILLAACIVSAGMGDYKTCAVLGVVILMNTVIGFWQEWNAERAISALESLSVPQCTVIREAQQRMVDSGELVPGDIVVLDEGSSIPADLRLCEVSQLAVIETLLTGESLPIEKCTSAIKGHRRVNIGDRLNMAYQSTVVSRGRGLGVVVNTGETTEIGRISAAIAGTHVGKTPLQVKLVRLGKLLVVMAMFACALVVACGLAWNPKDGDIIKTGVSLALSVIPEGLVAIVTLTMAMGMKRMAKSNALVRQLPAVETLGSVTTVCSDKTGTITEGVMRARLLWTPSGTMRVPTQGEGGSGLCQLSAMRQGTTAAHALAATSQLSDCTQGRELDEATQWQLTVMDLCNNSSVSKGPDGALTGLGDQTEVALKMLAVGVGCSSSKRLKRTAEVAFDSDRKRMSVVCSVLPVDDTPADATRPLALPSGEGGGVVLCKGAPEVLIELCTRFLGENGPAEMTSGVLQSCEKACEEFSAEGLRTLALAVRTVEDASSLYSEGTGGEREVSAGGVEKDLVLVGLVALADPPRKGIEKSIAACHAAGIRVVMITGDHISTATSIARAIGILPSAAYSAATGHFLLNGSALSSMTSEQLAALNPFPLVFSRVSPDNKLAIVKALQLRGDVAAMTGDGVNDAPALRQADVGVAMGRSGTDITRQAADIILADDNFSTIVVAVEEGRKIYDNIHKFMVYLLSCNLSEVVLMLITVAAGLPEPLSALQILYANIVVDIPPSLALGLEEVEPDAMQRPPRNPQKPILGKRYINALLAQALSMGLLSSAGYAIALKVEHQPVETARAECFAIMFMTQCAHAFMSRSVRNSIITSGPREVFFGNRWLFYGTLTSIIAVVAGLYLPGFNAIFELRPVDGWAWVKVFVAILLHLCVVEAGKYGIRRVGKPAVPGAVDMEHGQLSQRQVPCSV